MAYSRRPSTRVTDRLRENGQQVRRPGLDNSQGIEDRLRPTHLEMSGRLPELIQPILGTVRPSEGPPE